MGLLLLLFLGETLLLLLPPWGGSIIVGLQGQGGNKGARGRVKHERHGCTVPQNGGEGLMGLMGILVMVDERLLLRLLLNAWLVLLLPLLQDGGWIPSRVALALLRLIR